LDYPVVGIQVRLEQNLRLQVQQVHRAEITVLHIVKPPRHQAILSDDRRPATHSFQELDSSEMNNEPIVAIDASGDDRVRVISSIDTQLDKV